MLIEELIEKAFSDGYEYAQKEFISNRDLMRMNKRINTNIKKYNKNLPNVQKALKTDTYDSLKNTVNKQNKLKDNIIKSELKFGKALERNANKISGNKRTISIHNNYM